MGPRVTASPIATETSNELPRWQRRTVVGAGVCLLASGLVWLPVHHLWGAGASGLPHPLEAWLMRWHGLAAVAGFFAGGLVASGHVARGWRLRWRRPTGLSLCILGSLLAQSGYALWYLVPEGWRGAAGWAHAAAGSVAFAVGVLHAWGRARR